MVLHMTPYIIENNFKLIASCETKPNNNKNN